MLMKSRIGKKGISRKNRLHFFSSFSRFGSISSFFPFFYLLLLLFWRCAAIFWFRCSQWSWTHSNTLFTFSFFLFLFSPNVYIIGDLFIIGMCAYFTRSKRKRVHPAQPSICSKYRTCTAASNRIRLDTIALIPFIACSLCPFLFVHFIFFRLVRLHCSSLACSSAACENHIPCENIELCMHFFLMSCMCFFTSFDNCIKHYSSDFKWEITSSWNDKNGCVIFLSIDYSIRLCVMCMCVFVRKWVDMRMKKT